MSWLSFGLGALTLWLLQGLYRLGREHGAVSDTTDKKTSEYFAGVIRHMPRDPRADISKAQQGRWWN